MRAILAASLIALAPSAVRAQVTIDGRAAVPVPATLGPTGMIELYEERTRFALEEAQPVDLPPEPGSYAAPVPATIDAGAVVLCYLVHHDGAFPETATITLDGRVRLLGIVAGEARLDRWDPVCAPEYPVMYPTGDTGRGAIGSSDEITIRDDLRTVDVAFREGSSSLDQLRILVTPVASEDAGTSPRRDGGSSSAGDAGSTAEAAPHWDYRGSGGCTCRARGSTDPSGGAAAAGLLALALAIRRARRAG